MKRILTILVCAFGILTIISGCSSDSQSEKPIVNSGVVDEQYVGDPNPKLVNEYFQTSEEAEAQEEIVKAIEEEKASFEGGGLSGH
ncbi:MAG: hypothetical protein ACK4M9_21010 [Anaerobacillus sp.]|uniref:hypothetical protein n=1 Tax=Anaerobacillus sp. TaxID=1872506 RepID=UPI00391DFBD8